MPLDHRPRPNTSSACEHIPFDEFRDDSRGESVQFSEDDFKTYVFTDIFVDRRVKIGDDCDVENVRCSLISPVNRITTNCSLRLENRF